MSGTVRENGEAKELNRKSIFLKNIPKTFTVTGLQNLFKTYGKIDRWYARELENGGIGFAICSYENEWDAANALTTLQEQPHGWHATHAFMSERDKKPLTYEKGENKPNYHNKNERVVKEKNKFSNSTTNGRGFNNHGNKSNDEDTWDTPAEQENTSTPKPTPNPSFNKSMVNKSLGSPETKEISMHTKIQNCANNIIMSTKCKCHLPYPLVDLSHYEHIANYTVRLAVEQEECSACGKFFYRVVSETTHGNKAESIKHEKKYMNVKEQSNVSEKDQEIIATPTTTTFKYQKNARNPSPKKSYNLSPSQAKTTMKKLNYRNNESGESTPKSTAFKSAFKQFTLDSQVILTSITKFKDDSYLCVPISSNTNEHYTALLNDFSIVCNDVKGNISEQDIHGKIMAACIIEDNSKVWYRAVQLPNNQYAFIDVGSETDRSKIIRLIHCPPQFCNLPIFGTVLKTTNILKEGENIDCRVYEIHNDRQILKKIDGTEPFGSLHDWSVIFSRELSTESQDGKSKENRDPKKAITSPQFRIPSKKKHSTTNSETENKPLLENGCDVIIVHYVDSSEVYVRSALENNNRQYQMLLNDVHRSALESPSLTAKPEISTRVLAKYGNVYCRARVVSYDHSEKLYIVFLCDFGKKVLIPLESMRKMEASIANMPEHLICASLVNQELIVKEEPLEKIESVVKPFIEKEIVFNYSYNDKNRYSPKNVQLIAKQSRENLNYILTEIAKPVIEKLKEKGTKTYDLPVTFYVNTKYLQLNLNASPNSLVTLNLLNTTEFAQNTFVACTLRHRDTFNKMKSLLKRINDYCAEQEDHYIPRVGEMCLAFYQKDEKWHRATSLSHIDDSNKIEVYFVDIAVFMTVNVNAVKKMVPEFIEALPMYALRCYFDGFPDEPSSTMINETLDFLENKKYILVSSLTLEDDQDGIYKCSIPGLVSVLQKKNIYQ